MKFINQWINYFASKRHNIYRISIISIRTKLQYSVINYIKYSNKDKDETTGQCAVISPFKVSSAVVTIRNEL